MDEHKKEPTKNIKHVPLDISLSGANVHNIWGESATSSIFIRVQYVHSGVRHSAQWRKVECGNFEAGATFVQTSRLPERAAADVLCRRNTSRSWRNTSAPTGIAPSPFCLSICAVFVIFYRIWQMQLNFIWHFKHKYM